MPRTRLVRVAEASAPEDFNICDIAPGSYGSRFQVPSSKSPPNLRKVLAGRPTPWRRFVICCIADLKSAGCVALATRCGLQIREAAACKSALLRCGSDTPGAFGNSCLLLKCKADGTALSIQRPIAVVKDFEIGTIENFLCQLEVIFKRREVCVAIDDPLDQREKEIGAQRQGLRVNLRAAAD